MWYVIVVRGRFALMVKCKTSPTSPHHFKVHCSLNLFLLFFFEPNSFCNLLMLLFSFSCTLGMLIIVPFEHLDLKLLPLFSPIFAQMQPNNVHSWSLCFCYNQSKVFHLTFYGGICWELQAMSRSDASQK